MEGEAFLPIHFSSLLPAGLLPPSCSPLCPCFSGLSNPFSVAGLPHTLALGHAGGAIEVSAGVSWAAGAEVLTEVGLVGPHGTAEAAVGAGVVVVPRGALDCKEWGRQALRWQASGSSGAQDGQDTLIPAPKPLPEPSLAWPHQSLRPGENELDRAATTVPILFFRARGSAEPAQKPVCGVEGEVLPAL